jgi:hypothetical protein
MTMARPVAKPLPETEGAARTAAKRSLKEWPRDPYFFDADIQEITAIRDAAGRSNPYFSDPKAMFDRVGNELCTRLGWGDAAKREAV